MRRGQKTASQVFSPFRRLWFNGYWPLPSLANRLAKKHYNCADTKLKAPKHPLLYVPTHTARQEALVDAAENIASAIETDEKCAIVCQNPTAIAADLIQAIAAWDTLSTPVREAILTIVKNVAPSGR